MSDVDYFLYERIFPNSGIIFGLNVKPIKEIKENCIYLLDTNVLLVPYTASRTSLKEIKNIYDKLITQQRLFIPGHVVREFSINRPEKMKEIFSNLNKKLSSNINIFIDKYPILEEDKVYIDIMSNQNKIDKLIEDHRKMVKTLINTINQWDWNDPVSKLYKEIFMSNVIYDPKIDEELINKEFEFRCDHKIPPGYKDKTKEINSAGDLIIWTTILKIAEEKQQNVIFVSSEEKPDWFHCSEKRALFPRFELQYEFQMKVPDKSFHIIKLSDLLQLFDASKNVVDEVKLSEDLLKDVMMQRTNVESSNLKSVGYDEDNEILEIEFLHGGIYQYFDVPISVYEGLMSADSHGKYFDRNVKKAGYRYKKVR